MAARHYKLATAAVMLSLAASVFSIFFFLSFDGDLSNIFAGDTPQYNSFKNSERMFHSFSSDEILVVSSPNFGSAEELETLRELHFDLLLADGVQQVISAFSVSALSEDQNNWSTVFPEQFTAAMDVPVLLQSLESQYPPIRALFDSHSGTALFLVSFTDAQIAAGKPALNELLELVVLYENQGLNIHFAGESVVERELVAAVQIDVFKLVTLGIAMAIIISWFLFRSAAAIFVCIMPLLVSLAWYLGLIAVLGLKIDVVMVVVPVLVIILVFAEMLHIYLQWRGKVAEGMDPHNALIHAVSICGPACALASATTGIAFLMLSIADNKVLDQMALGGLLGVVVIFLSVMVIGPVTALWAIRFKMRFGPVFYPILNIAVKPGVSMMGKRSRIILLGLIFVIPALMYVHFIIPPQFSLLAYLPKGSEVAAANKKLDQFFNGSDQVSVLFNRRSSDAVISPSEIEKLQEVEEIIDHTLGRNTAISIASVITGSNQSGIDLSSLPEQGELLLRRYLSADKHYLAVTSPISISTEAARLNGQMAKIRDELANKYPDTEFSVTGSSVMKAAIAPELIGDLRNGLIISVLLSIILIGFSFGSWQIAVACLLPNVLPILAVEFVLWLVNGHMDMSTTIALMIGFGLAVDDTVHFLNHYSKTRLNAENDIDAIKTAIVEISPALVATTVIVGLGTCVTFLSTLPTVSLFGVIIIATLIFALLADILILPSILLLVKGLTGRNI